MPGTSAPISVVVYNVTAAIDVRPQFPAPLRSPTCPRAATP
jgi:hypothetical protein